MESIDYLYWFKNEESYDETVKLTTEQNYINGLSSNYDYIRNHYIFIAVNLSRQNELYANSKPIQQIEFVG